MVHSILLVLFLFTSSACSGQTKFYFGEEDQKVNKPNPTLNVEGVGKHLQHKDEFNQKQKGVLDILVVIDNSSSMRQEQSELSKNLPALLEYVKESDWQIAVISTSRQDCLNERITKNTTDYANKYKNMVNLGIDGSDVELYFYQTIQGLKGECQGTTTAWLRENSTIAILIVGDEGTKCDPYYNYNIIPTDMPCKSSHLTTYLKSIRSETNAKVYGLLKVSSWTADELSIFAAYGSISDTSYSNTLQKISQNVQDTLEDVFPLSQIPSSNVKVVVNGDAPLNSSKYTIDTKSKQLQFNKGYVPPDKATIVVTYDYLTD